MIRETDKKTLLDVLAFCIIIPIIILTIFLVWKLLPEVLFVLAVSAYMIAFIWAIVHLANKYV